SGAVRPSTRTWTSTRLPSATECAPPLTERFLGVKPCACATAVAPRVRARTAAAEAVRSIGTVVFIGSSFKVIAACSGHPRCSYAGSTPPHGGYSRRSYVVVPRWETRAGPLGE